MVEQSNMQLPDGSVFDPKAYEVLLRPLEGDEGGGWLATIPLLPGCTGDGDSELAAIADVRLAAFEWVEAALVQNETIPPPARQSSIAAE